MSLQVIERYLTNNRCYQAGASREPHGIQIHSIGTGQGTAESVASYWNQPSVAACVTYVVDADIPGKVLQLLPEWMRSWADAGWGNRELITIELCESDYISYTGGASYIVKDSKRFEEDIRRGYDTAVKLCAQICKRYGWNPQGKLANDMYLISSHNEGASGRAVFRTRGSGSCVGKSWTDNGRLSKRCKKLDGADESEILHPENLGGENISERRLCIS